MRAGKSIVHSLGGLHPRHLLPIVVDAGCNTTEIREDELYIGIKQVLFLPSCTSPYHPLCSVLGHIP